MNIGENNITLATAHPSKFPEAIERSINIKPNIPNELEHILNKKEKYDVISNDLDQIKKYIKNRI